MYYCRYTVHRFELRDVSRKQVFDLFVYKHDEILIFTYTVNVDFIRFEYVVLAKY
jgi:hypothetical protein